MLGEHYYEAAWFAFACGDWATVGMGFKLCAAFVACAEV